VGAFVNVRVRSLWHTGHWREVFSFTEGGVRVLLICVVNTTSSETSSRKLIRNPAKKAILPSPPSGKLVAMMKLATPMSTAIVNRFDDLFPE